MIYMQKREALRGLGSREVPNPTQDPGQLTTLCLRALQDQREAYLFPNAVTMPSKELSYLSKGRLCPERVDSMNSDSPKYFLLSGYSPAP